MNESGRSMPRKPGRPRKTDDETAVVIRLQKRHAEMLDSFISDELTKLAVLTREQPTSRRVANERRRFLGKLIEEHLGFEAQHPVKLSIVAPATGTAKVLGEVADWLTAQEERLLEDAPEPIKTTIEVNKLMRRHVLRKDSAEMKEQEDDDKIS